MFTPDKHMLFLIDNNYILNTITTLYKIILLTKRTKLVYKIYVNARK